MPAWDVNLKNTVTEDKIQEIADMITEDITMDNGLV